MNSIATVRKSGGPEVRTSFLLSLTQIRNVTMRPRLQDFRTSGCRPTQPDFRTSRSAFTILELLLVLVILAVLAGIVGSRFVGQSQSAKIKAATTQLQNFKLALGRYEIDIAGALHHLAREGFDHRHSVLRREIWTNRSCGSAYHPAGGEAITRLDVL